MPPKRISIRNPSSPKTKVPVTLVKWLMALMPTTSVGEERLTWSSPAFCTTDFTGVLERHVIDTAADCCRTSLYSTVQEKEITT